MIHDIEDEDWEHEAAGEVQGHDIAYTNGHRKRRKVSAHSKSRLERLMCHNLNPILTPHHPPVTNYSCFLILLAQLAKLLCIVPTSVSLALILAVSRLRIQSRSTKAVSDSTLHQRHSMTLH